MNTPPEHDSPGRQTPVDAPADDASLVPPAIDSWHHLRQFTAARIALGRTGVSLPTDAHLAFQLAHARARDAVHLPLNVPVLLRALSGAGVAAAANCLVLDSAAGDRLSYLQRPDLGRRLSDAARDSLVACRRSRSVAGYDLALVIGDGLSARAVTEHAAPFLAALMALLAQQNWSLAPLTIVRQARVAIGDDIGELLGARMVVVLIGERPGLSSPDSMGLYMTWMPKVGLTDARRNCISNVRPAGLDVQSAAAKLHYLLTQARRRQLSGVLLKDDSGSTTLQATPPATSFLLPGERGKRQKPISTRATIALADSQPAHTARSTAQSSGVFMQSTSRHLTLFHCPNTRSTGVLILLEELQADYELHVLNMKTGEQRGAAYLAINPMGKVPAVLHGAALVTEQAALYLYLADLYPEAGLAPGLTDPLRGPYLRWMVYYASCFEPAVIDRSQKREPAPVGMSPYGDFDTMLKTLTDQLAGGPYMLGERFTALDILWGTALGWITKFGLVPVTPVIERYVELINRRPSIATTRAKDAELAAAQA